MKMFQRSMLATMMFVGVFYGDIIEVLHNNRTFANGFQRSTTFAA